MKRSFKAMGKGVALLAAAALAVSSLAAQAASDPEAQPRRDQEQQRRELERARQEVEKARAELQRATRELAQSMARVERDNPRAQYFEYMTDPNRAVLGILIADEMDNGEDRGIRVLAVTPGAGADKAGLKAGDLITAMNGNTMARDGKLSPQKRLRDVLHELKAGDEVRVDYERDGKRNSATIKTQAPEPEIAMAPLPMLQDWIHNQDFDQWMPGLPSFRFHGAAIRGLELAKLDDDLGAYFKTKDGVLVVKAPKDGALKLKSGDVIQKIDGDAVSEPVTVLDKLHSRRDEQSVKLEIMRQGKKLELEGKIPVADRGHKRQRININVGDDDEEDGT